MKQLIDSTSFILQQNANNQNLTGNTWISKVYFHTGSASSLRFLSGEKISIINKPLFYDACIDIDLHSTLLPSFIWNQKEDEDIKVQGRMKCLLFMAQGCQEKKKKKNFIRASMHLNLWKLTPFMKISWEANRKWRTKSQ